MSDGFTGTHCIRLPDHPQSIIADDIDDDPEVCQMELDILEQERILLNKIKEKKLEVARKRKFQQEKRTKNTARL